MFKTPTRTERQCYLSLVSWLWDIFVVVHVAFINATCGAAFVKTLVQQLDLSRNSESIDFVKLLTRVNHDVAYGFTSDVRNEKYKMYTRKKQMPRISTRLTRRLIFRRRKELARSSDDVYQHTSPKRAFCSPAQTESFSNQ